MVISDWDADKSAAFTRKNLVFEHTLHDRPLFSDAGLADILERYPRDRLGVFAMGDDPVEWRTWRRGTGEGLSGVDLLRAVAEGRIWLNLRAVNEVAQEYADLSDEIFADKEAHVRGLRTFKRDVGLLISSPHTQVFYHLDVALVSLWQIRGVKRVFLYPVAEPYVGDRDIERIVLRETAEQFAYDPAWDAGAEMVALEPGKMVTWPQNAPHRVVNEGVVNVSLSIEFMTPAALVRANMIFANGVLRRRFGMRPRLQTGIGPVPLAKFAFARAVKALGLQKESGKKLPVTFDLRRGVPGAPLPVAAAAE